MRKILKNNNKSKRLSGTKKGKLGTQLCIIDKLGQSLSVGDEIKYGKYRGVLLYNPHYDQYGIAFSDRIWYGNDKYDINSYENFIEIPMDNGARMDIEKL